MLSSDLTQQQGNLFSTPRPAPHRKQTVVYHLSGEIFSESDTEQEKEPAPSAARRIIAPLPSMDLSKPVDTKKERTRDMLRNARFKMDAP